MDMIDDRGIFKNLVNNIKSLIDRNIYKFLFTLLYYIIRDDKKKLDKEESNQLEKNKADKSFLNKTAFIEFDKKIEYINDKYIKNEKEKLNKDYTK